MITPDQNANDNESHLIGNILAEDNSGTSYFLYSLLDSDSDDLRGSKLNFGGAFGIGSNTPYGGAFNAVPDRVGSAPNLELNVVIFYILSFNSIEIRKLRH